MAGEEGPIAPAPQGGPNQNHNQNQNPDQNQNPPPNQNPQNPPTSLNSLVH